MIEGESLDGRRGESGTARRRFDGTVDRKRKRLAQDVESGRDAAEEVKGLGNSAWTCRAVQSHGAACEMRATREWRRAMTDATNSAAYAVEMLDVQVKSGP